MVDLDPQANLSQSLGLTNHQERNIYQAIKGEAPLDPVEILPGLHVIPSTLDLSGAEIELAGRLAGSISSGSSWNRYGGNIITF